MKGLKFRLTVLALCTAIAPARGQTAASNLHGITRGGDSSTALSGVEIRFTELRLVTTSDARGAFTFDRVPAGRWRLQLRRVGYAAIDTIVIISDVPPATVAFTMRSLPQRLDTVNVSGPVEPFGAIAEFEARRARGTGRFLTRDELRANDERGFVDVLRSRVPGLAFQTTASAVYAFSRSQQAPGALLGNTKPCYAQIVVDGIVIYQQAMRGGPEPPDISQFLTQSLDAVEYYSGPSRTPPEFRTTGAACGTLALWTRRR